MNKKKVVMKAKFETSTKGSNKNMMYTLHYGSIFDLDMQLIIDLYEN